MGEFINTNDYELEVAISKTQRSTECWRGGGIKSIDRNKTYQGKVTRINGRVDLLPDHYRLLRGKGSGP